MPQAFTYWSKILLGVAAIAVVAKFAFGIALSLSFLIFAAWLFIGFLVQFDDFFPGGWSNPDRSEAVPWLELGWRFVVFLGAVVLFATLNSGGG